jgi:uncharacterized membrane protein
MTDTETAETVPTRSFRLGGYLLGFALGGFFDGILLHQVLQWHHLLSGLQQEDIRFLILTDGLFHLLMYVVALVGLWALWRKRTPVGARGLLAAVLIGFGVWHGVDAVVSHWLIGIHRIRMDTDIPLFWDLLWLVIFGIIPMVIGIMLRRNGGGGGRQPMAFRVALTLVVLLAAPVAALPPSDDRPVLVLFGPAITAAAAMDAIGAAGGRVRSSDGTGQVWTISLEENSHIARLYANGAVFVSSSYLPAGCLNWIDA